MNISSDPSVIISEAELNAHIKHAKKLLFRTLNCSESQIIPLQLIHNIDNDPLLSAVTGLAGGIYNRGSTCGVLFGTSINYAMIRDSELANWTLTDQVTLLSTIRAYVDWFEAKYGSSLCRERTELDFQTIKGKVGLLIPEKAKGCVSQTAKSIRYFITTEPQAVVEEVRCESSFHCAQAVLQKVRQLTGVGDDSIERISIALSGGIGLSGGGCGALAGGIMALGLQHGSGHKKDNADRLLNIFRSMPRKFSRMTNTLIDNFEAEYGALECNLITGRRFDDYCDFQAYSPHCSSLIDFVVSEVSLFLKKA